MYDPDSQKYKGIRDKLTISVLWSVYKYIFLKRIENFNGLHRSLDPHDMLGRKPAEISNQKLNTRNICINAPARSYQPGVIGLWQMAFLSS